MEKAVNVLKVISSIVFLGTLLYVYSLLPVIVQLRPEDSSWSLHKEYFFYGAIIFFMVLNICLIVIERLLSPSFKSEELRAWIKGLAVVLNFYLACMIGSLGVMNNANDFGPGSYSYLNFIGPVLIVMWLIGLIFNVLIKPKTD